MKGARGGLVRGGGNPGARPHLCSARGSATDQTAPNAQRSQAGREKRVSDLANAGDELPHLQGFRTGMGGGQEGWAGPPGDIQLALQRPRRQTQQGREEGWGEGGFNSPSFNSQLEHLNQEEGHLSAGYVSRDWMVSSKGQDTGNPIRQVCGQLNWKVGPIKSRESRIHDSVLSLKETQGY